MSVPQFDHIEIRSKIKNRMWDCWFEFRFEFRSCKLFLFLCVSFFFVYSLEDIKSIDNFVVENSYVGKIKINKVATISYLFFLLSLFCQIRQEQENPISCCNEVAWMIVWKDDCGQHDVDFLKCYIFCFNILFLCIRIGLKSIFE